MLEELLALGHAGAEYDAWLIRIGDGDQFSNGFVAVNPNSKIPALLDRSGKKPVRVFESGAILRISPRSSVRSCRRKPPPERNACPGCSGKWAAPLIWAAASAIFMPTRRSRSNTRSAASRWRSSASSTCSTGASLTMRILAATHIRLVAAIVDDICNRYGRCDPVSPIPGLTTVSGQILWKCCGCWNTASRRNDPSVRAVQSVRLLSGLS